MQLEKAIEKQQVDGSKFSHPEMRHEALAKNLRQAPLKYSLPCGVPPKNSRRGQKGDQSHLPGIIGRDPRVASEPRLH